ncbi:hypothetical protein DPMN_001019 [Dreissena polymorpha]|uniref:Uncharacterized protein n=1 Tax=Dreissena polymorpha TaxID=45954 RepID=A0A9D4MGH7_DREPO|nr:hypothetical protein DPMN_001019 [Dreissena polymorpha]
MPEQNIFEHCIRIIHYKTMHKKAQNVCMLTRKKHSPMAMKNAQATADHFHEDRTINVGFRVKKIPALEFGDYTSLLELPLLYIIGTNLLTKFHEDRKINVASRVLTKKNALPPGSHVFQPTGIIF